MRHDPLADLFVIIKNTESIGKKTCTAPASKLAHNVLKIMKERGYIGGFKYNEDGRGGTFMVSLIGKINDCNVIKPRFSIKDGEFIKWEKRYLPATDVGILILTTDKGVMDQHMARKKKTGGKLLGFVY